ncbi:hypothetical protein swp_0870 [Shewanella piezotolerans WP3]|uniref:Uncharacterized protein n=1 Tax=Shewanella piezotolerans (strain WP3 / JCM 13877) TaxID=225849 RepID=B8CJX5_SHEPW|nr:hypothetical protein swp_0870 [Shewanella piezotolerans WP3]
MVAIFRVHIQFDWHKPQLCAIFAALVQFLV